MLHRIFEHSIRQISRPEGQIRLIMTLLVKNEAEIVADNIRFHARQGVDGFVVMDNNSDDGTCDILEGLKKEVDLQIIHQPQQNYQQAKWMTELAFAARSRMGADLVISNDADEFYRHKAGNNLKSVLSPKDTLVTVNRYNMALDRNCLNDDYHYSNATLKVTSPILYNKETQIGHEAVSMLLVKISPKVIVNPYGLWQIKGGNHRAKHFWGSFSNRNEGDIEVIHYPIRSYAQFERNIANRKRLIENTKARMGDHYRRWVALYNEGKLEQEFEKFVLSAQDTECLLRLGVLTESPEVSKAIKAGISPPTL